MSGRVRVSVDLEAASTFARSRGLNFEPNSALRTICHMLNRSLAIEVLCELCGGEGIVSDVKCAACEGEGWVPSP